MFGKLGYSMPADLRKTQIGLAKLYGLMSCSKMVVLF